MGFLNIIGLILPIILFSLGTLHVYWALGGNWGASGAIPTFSFAKIMSIGNLVG